VVVGGGVVGLMTALRLGSCGWRVAMVERDQLGSGATLSNHGIVHSGALFAPLHPEIVPACYAAQSAYEVSFPAALVDVRPAWYPATPPRLAELEKRWAELGIPYAEVEAAEVARCCACRARCGLVWR
jgi:glycine/D-amino acid oxidase-like deaminating enzyme